MTNYRGKGRDINRCVHPFFSWTNEWFLPLYEWRMNYAKLYSLHVLCVPRVTRLVDVLLPLHLQNKIYDLSSTTIKYQLLHECYMMYRTPSKHKKQTKRSRIRQRTGGKRKVQLSFQKIQRMPSLFFYDSSFPLFMPLSCLSILCLESSPPVNSFKFLSSPLLLASVTWGRRMIPTDVFFLSSPQVLQQINCALESSGWRSYSPSWCTICFQTEKNLNPWNSSSSRSKISSLSSSSPPTWGGDELE